MLDTINFNNQPWRIHLEDNDTGEITITLYIKPDILKMADMLSNLMTKYDISHYVDRTLYNIETKKITEGDTNV